jgi:hypothetical protein
MLRKLGRSLICSERHLVRPLPDSQLAEVSHEAPRSVIGFTNYN